MLSRCIEPARRPVSAELDASPSKSETHRALVAAALAGGESRIERPLDAADTRRTRYGLESLGIRVQDEALGWVVHGRSGRVPGGGDVDCGASGTTARFLTALAATGERASRVHGTARLHERPMGDLVEALSALGASIHDTGGGLPVLAGGVSPRGGRVEIAGSRSSQFASALLLVGAALPDGLDLEVAPPRASFAYARLTAQVLGAFGVAVEQPREGAFRIARQNVATAHLRVGGDHSSASYLFLAAAVTGGRVQVSGLDPASLQPDARFARDLAAVGCAVAAGEGTIAVEGASRLEPFDWDLEDAPDLAPTAAVLALFCGGPSRLRGLTNLRLKESDRLLALEAGLARLGADVRGSGGELVVAPPRGPAGPALVEVAGDHRIAMAFAIAGLRRGGVTLDDATVVAKSYPGFWTDFDALAAARTGS